MEIYQKDHYKILGLPSGVEARKLSQQEITKAYHVKALQLHPDKQPNNPNANKNFQLLGDSYEILKDEYSRSVVDAHILVTHYQQQQQQQEEQPPPRRRRRRRRSKGEQPQTSAEKHSDTDSGPPPSAESSGADIAGAESSSADIASEPQPQQSEPSVGSPGGTPLQALPSIIPEQVPEEKMYFNVWWKIGDGLCDYGPDELSELFTDFGRVEDIFNFKLLNESTVSAVVAVDIPSSEAEDIACFVQRGVIGNPSNRLRVRIGVPCK